MDIIQHDSTDPEQCFGSKTPDSTPAVSSIASVIVLNDSAVDSSKDSPDWSDAGPEHNATSVNKTSAAHAGSTTTVSLVPSLASIVGSDTAPLIPASEIIDLTTGNGLPRVHIDGAVNESDVIIATGSPSKGSRVSYDAPRTINKALANSPSTSFKFEYSSSALEKKSSSSDTPHATRVSPRLECDVDPHISPKIRKNDKSNNGQQLESTGKINCTDLVYEKSKPIQCTCNITSSLNTTRKYKTSSVKRGRNLAAPSITIRDETLAPIRENDNIKQPITSTLDTATLIKSESDMPSLVLRNTLAPFVTNKTDRNAPSKQNTNARSTKKSHDPSNTRKSYTRSTDRNIQRDHVLLSPLKLNKPDIKITKDAVEYSTFERERDILFSPKMCHEYEAAAAIAEASKSSYTPSMSEDRDDVALSALLQ
ncbi:unnamed protein product [Diatraea saccharalis]|uniref:Uncharacterized protein n=1 Tax=Diatraea saccharalis TaxID=40085 RepID=A0A9N9R302_9NEOP|nr:unnamed protein product [Diatraea saccharalis]